jgi:vacuolar-type H+-ATPase subunit E/Vma4
MCEFVSAVKTQHIIGKDKYYYLTYELIHNTPRGKLLQEKYKGDDLIGHSAIREYFDLRGGDNWECTYFSTPKNFPAVIVKAIKGGEFRGFGTPEGLLSQQASAEYKKIKQQAWTEYERIRQPAWTEYKKIEQQALAEYKKIEQQALAEYERIKQQALDEYEKIEQPASAEYERIKQQALDEYEKIVQQAFWDLFAIKENRSEVWR